MIPQKPSSRTIADTQTIYRKAILQIIVVASLIAIGILAVFYLLTRQIIQTEELQTKTALIQLVTIAKTSIDPILARVKDGSITVEQGQMESRAIIRRMVYQDSYGANYIFMSTYDGIMLVQPFSPELEGSNQINLTDIYGKYIIQSLIKSAELYPSGGFVDYYFPPPNSTKAEQKISYVVGLPEINAYIGAGIYPSQSYRQQQSQLVILGVISVLLLGLLSILTVQSVNRIKDYSDSILKQKKAEQNLSTVFNSTHDAILVHDQVGKIIAANVSTLQMYHLTLDQLTGMTIMDISAPDSEQRYVLEDIWCQVLAGKNLMIEWISIRPDDKVRMTVEATLSRIVWNDNQNILAVFRDITDRIKIQADIEKNEWLLEYAQSLSHIGHFYYDVSTRQITWSKELFHIFGLEPQTDPPSNVLPPLNSISGVEVDGQQTMVENRGEEGTITTRNKIVRADGEEREVLIIMDSIKDQKNVIVAYVGSVQDMTAILHDFSSLHSRAT